jgi:hypothetical protein
VNNSEINPVPDPCLAHDIVDVVLEVNFTMTLVKFYWLSNSSWEVLFDPFSEFTNAFSISSWTSRIEKLENCLVFADKSEESNCNVLRKADHDNRVLELIPGPS